LLEYPDPVVSQDAVDFPHEVERPVQVIKHGERRHDRGAPIACISGKGVGLRLPAAKATELQFSRDNVVPFQPAGVGSGSLA